jgi:hypothetical protein
MTFRQASLIGFLALLGLVAAAAMGIAANAVSGDSIGLSAEPLSAGTQLAPKRAEDRPGHHAREDRGRHDDRPSTTTATTTPTTTAPTTATTTGIEPGDDSGGSVNSGSGSTSSGSGSSGSGSSGSSGSDD